MENELSLQDLNINLSVALNSSKNPGHHSTKSTESAENLELKYIYENIETLVQESDSYQSLKDLIINSNSDKSLTKYQNCLLSKNNSRKLFRNFLKEKFRLIKSETKTLGYSNKEVLLRLKTGYSVYKYKRKVKQRRVVKIIVDDCMLKIKNMSSKCYKRIPFDSVYGVILGCETSSFKHNKIRIDKICGQIHNEHDCFSIVTDIGSYDFASVSDRAVYDICIGISWLAFHYSTLPCCIPYSKFSLTATIVSLKIREMAEAKYISIVELFLLSICKTLKDQKKDYTPILSMLNKRFSGESKIARFISKSILLIINEQKSKEHFKNALKANYLASSMNASEKNLQNLTQILKSKTKNEHAPFAFVAFFVPKSTKIFQKPKKRDKIEFSRHSSVVFSTTTIKRGSNGSIFKNYK